MNGAERRRVERHAVDLPGGLHLSEGRCIPIRIVNLGELGALVSMTDLEEAVFEGERVVLEHPVMEEGEPTATIAHTAGRVVRVDLELSDLGVARHLAVFFDGGAPPSGYREQ